jgi:hypothetical protein
MYRKLFNAQTDAIQGLEAITANLKKAQQETEQMYMDAPETALRLADAPPKNGQEDGKK